MVCFVELDLVEEAYGIVPASKRLMLHYKFICGLAMTATNSLLIEHLGQHYLVCRQAAVPSSCDLCN